MEPEAIRQRGRLGSVVPRISSALSNMKDSRGKMTAVGADSKKHVRLQVDPGEEEIVSQLTDLNLNKDSLRSGTGLVYDPIMAEPRCLWDSDTPECPERVTTIMERLNEYGLVDRCEIIEPRSATKEELQLVHTPDYVDLIKSMENMDTVELRAQSDGFDLVYFHQQTYTACCTAVGCVLQLVDELMKGHIRNGLAVVRPPGHHAHEDTANSYCIFNTLAVAAVYARKVHGVERVLIVDWDIYHGQGTQYIFEEDPRVLLFSIHRYEHGDFWPHLAESDCTTTGTGWGQGFNINLPWNKTGMSDADYFSAFYKLLLPIAHEYRPDLILVYAGFNSVLGDPQGRMSATPACFAHLTHMLMPLAEGKLLLSLEGGFNLRATADATATCLKVLLGDSCPQLISIATPSQSAMESISSVISVQRKFWKCLQNHELSSWRDTQPFVDTEEQLDNEDATLDLIMAEVMRPLPPRVTGLLYDERMMEHHNMWDFQHPEQPQRISQIFARHQELGLLDRCLHIHAQSATETQLEMCHGSLYISTLKSTREMTNRELHRQSCEYNSIFISPQSYETALLAVGALFTVVEAVIIGQVQNGVAIIRPPGHHAERDVACGFCFFNNVALAARFAQNLVGHKIKVLIIDWDVHHGNGTQHMFEDDPSVLYISLHRYDNGSFFPNSDDADFDKVGLNRGEGFTVNIPWNGSRMGDAEYMAAFHRVVMPISYEFQPDLVLVSAGFDAARGDPMGGCEVTPECYAHMTHMIMCLAGGRVIFALEGGYNLTAISESMAMCTRTLLGDTPPYLEPMGQPASSAAETINNVISVHHKYWAGLRLLSPELDLQSKAKGTTWSQQPPPTSLPSQEPRVQVSQSRRTSMWLQQQMPLVSVMEPDPQTSQSRRASVWSQQFSFQVPDVDTENLLPSQQTWQDQSPSHATDDESGHKNSRHRVSIWSQQLPPAQKAEASDPYGPKKPLWPQEPLPSPFAVMPMDLPSSSDTFSLTVPERGAAAIGRAGGAKLGARPKVKTRKAELRKMSDESREADSSSGSTSRLRGSSEEDLAAPSQSQRCPQPENPMSISSAASGFLNAVVPLNWCPHLKMVKPIPAVGLSVSDLCEECQNETENWVCLTCYKVCCGRYVNEHMLIHSLQCVHMMVLSYTDFSVWCYGCDAYVHNEVLLPMKTEAHQQKFGSEPPSSI